MEVELGVPYMYQLGVAGDTTRSTMWRLKVCLPSITIEYSMCGFT